MNKPDAQPNRLPPQGSSRNIVLVLTCLSSFLTPFMGSSINVALPSISQEFALDAVTLPWVTTAYLLASAVFMVPLGRLADIRGRKRIYIIGAIVYTIASLLIALSNSSFTLLAFRALQGIGSSMIFGIGTAILISVFPPGERGRVLGINVGVVYLALALGPFIGGIMTEHLGWRSLFWANVPLGIIIASLFAWKLKGEWAEARGEKFDVPGSALYGVAIISVMYGFSLVPDLTAAWAFMGGAAGIAAFIWWELRVAYPVLNLKLFRHNPVFTFSNLAALTNYGATWAVSFLLSLYLQYIKGFTPESAGIVLLAMPALQAIFSPFMGRLSDRLEPRLLATSGMGLTVAGLAVFIFLGPDTPLALIIGILMLLGLGFALFSSPNTNAIMSSVEIRFAGVASGTLGTMRLTGQMLSMGVAMLLFALFMGRAPISPSNYPEFLQSARTAFMVFTGLCALGIGASLARGRLR
jgi:EmrB/QacA subfamily drug resistance transporter